MELVRKSRVLLYQGMFDLRDGVLSCISNVIAAVMSNKICSIGCHRVLLESVPVNSSIPQRATLK